MSGLQSLIGHGAYTLPEGVAGPTAPATGLVGAGQSGMQFLNAMQGGGQSPLSPGFKDQGASSQLGGILNFVNQFDASRPVGLKLEQPPPLQIDNTNRDALLRALSVQG